MTNRRIATVDDPTSGLRTAAASAPPKPLTVTLGAFVEAVTKLTDDVDEIVAVISHVLRTRAVPLGDLNGRALLGAGSAAAHPPTPPASRPSDRSEIPKADQQAD